MSTALIADRLGALAASYEAASHDRITKTLDLVIDDAMELVKRAYAEGLRDGFAQGVAAAASESAP